MSDFNQNQQQQSCLSNKIDHEDSSSKNTPENANIEYELLNKDNIGKPHQNQQSSNSEYENIQYQNQNECENEQPLLNKKQQDISFFKNKKIQYSIFLFLLTIVLLLLYPGELSYLRQDFNLSNQNQTIIKNLNTVDNVAMNDIEKEILKKLKGQRTTIEKNNNKENDNFLRQITVKTDLLSLKQRMVKNHVFEVYFLILLGKLEKIHELGIVHGDIKPQNIAITYDNEPFFVNFQTQDLLSENYQKNCFNPQYNQSQNVKLDDGDEEIKYITQKFNNLEELKLCDKTQFALTFLYLLCEEVSELQLFENKEYKTLLDYKLGKKPEEFKNQNMKTKYENKQIILKIMSQILLEADQNIKLEEIQIENPQFIINFGILQMELYKTNNIFYNKEENIYTVLRIDQISIKLIYLLDQLGCKLQIKPENTQIIPQPNNKEYQHILGKYTQIEEYFNEINNFQYIQKKLYRFDKQFNACIYFFNLSEYVQSDMFDKTQIINISYQNGHKEFQYCLHSVLKQAYINNFNINLQIYQQNIQEFILMMTKSYPDFQIQSIYQQEYSQMICKIIKINNNKDQTMNIELNLNEKQETDNWISTLTNITKENPKISYDLNIRSNLYQTYFDKDQLESIQNKLKDINGAINSFYQEYYPYIKTLRFKQNLDIEKFQQQVFFINSLKDMRQENYSFKSVKIIFQKYFFEQKFIWEEFREYLKSDQSRKISKIILIECQFSKETEEIIEDIKQNYKNIKYSYFEQYEQEQTNQESSSMFGGGNNYKLNLEYSSEQAQEQELEIQFYQQFTEKKQQKGRGLLFGDEFNDDYLDMLETDQTNESEENIEINEKEKQNISLQQQIKSIQNFIEPEQLFKSYLFNNIPIPNSASHIIENIKNVNKIAFIQKQEDIYYLIQDLRNKEHFRQIQITIGEFFFTFMQQQVDIILNNKNNNKIDKQISFEDLGEMLINNYESFQNINFQQKQQQYKNFQVDVNFQNIKNLEKEKPSQFKNSVFYESASSFFGVEDFFMLQYKFTATKEGINYSYDKRNEYQSKSKDVSKFLSHNHNRFQNSSVFQYMIKEFVKQDSYILVFNLSPSNLSNKPLKTLIQGIENKFSHQKKIIQINSILDLKVKGTLYDIYEIIKTYKQNQAIIFDVQSYDRSLSYFEFKQFIKKIIIHKNSHQEFQFEIHSTYEEIIQFIENEFKNYLQPQLQNNNQNQSKFQFKLSFYYDYNRQNQLMNVKSERKTNQDNTYLINLTNLDQSKRQDFIKMLDTHNQFN